MMKTNGLKATCSPTTLQDLISGWVIQDCSVSPLYSRIHGYVFGLSRSRDMPLPSLTHQCGYADSKSTVNPRHKPYRGLANVQPHARSAHSGAPLFRLLQECDCGMDSRSASHQPQQILVAYTDWFLRRSKRNDCRQRHAWPRRHYGEWVSDGVLPEFEAIHHGVEQHWLPSRVQREIHRGMGY